VDHRNHRNLTAHCLSDEAIKLADGCDMLGEAKEDKGNDRGESFVSFRGGHIPLDSSNRDFRFRLNNILTKLFPRPSVPSRQTPSLHGYCCWITGLVNL
jgi:hypothetical protein